MILLDNVNKLALTAALLVCGAAQAAEEFKSAIVTQSTTYERQKRSVSIAGIPAARSMTDVSRVAVALDGMVITGEWEPKTVTSTSADDFKRGTEVPAAIERNKLLLKLPDGSVVKTKIVRREKQEPPRETREPRG
ncbi:MAG TPA: hypothetical protein VJA26_02740 [Gammaproteobacteria bacterium]|nr:hypothetical protein [Gammaproteobacteria bacterium]